MNMVKNAMRFLAAVVTSSMLLALIVGSYSHEAVFYRVLAVAFGLLFGAQYTRLPGGGSVPLIKKPIHEALYLGGWGIYFYGFFWVVGDICVGSHGEHVYFFCWSAGFLPGFLLGCGQPLKGAGRVSWWLCENTFIGWMRSTMRLSAIGVIGYYALSQIVTHIVDPTPAISWHSIGMMVAALVSLSHTWLAIPHAPTRATRVAQGAFRTNMNPALS